jgi:hypothetical protein
VGGVDELVVRDARALSEKLVVRVGGGGRVVPHRVQFGGGDVGG